MLPGSSNHPVRKREEKGRRKEGKSQCRRGGTTKSRLVPIVVQIPQAAVPSVPPSKTAPSPGPLPSPIAPPTVAIPVVTVPLPIAGTLLKDPHAMSPSVPVREGKAIRRKVKEKEKEPLKTTTPRPKKNSATQSVSIEAKCSSETDGSKTAGSKNEKKKKSSQTASDLDNKSDGSKEPSENDEKGGTKINTDLAKNFFRHIIESQRGRKRSDDARLETMPESSQINSSVRALRKKTKKLPKSEPDTNFFKPNGEPVWVVPENAEERCEDGTIIKNPELAKAMAEEEIELDEKHWSELIYAYIGCTLPDGPTIPSDHNFDPFAPVDELEQLNQYVTPEKVSHNLGKNLLELSENAIARFEQKRAGMEERVRRAPAPAPDTTTTTESATISLPPIQTVSQELFQPTTLPKVTFNIKGLITVSYDRHNALSSIRKYLKKTNNTYSLEQSTQVESKEKS